MTNTMKCTHCNATIEQRWDSTGAYWFDPDEDGDGTWCFGGTEQRHQPFHQDGRDSRDDRPREGESMVDWTKPAEFQFANEVDGLTTLQELGEELRQAREQVAHITRYLHVAVQSLSRQHHTQPQAMIRESGLARQTVYDMLDGLICSECEQPIERHRGTESSYRHRAGAPVWCDAKPPVPKITEDEEPDREPSAEQERAWDEREDEARGHALTDDPLTAESYPA